MIRYLSCTHRNAEQNLTEQELKLFKAGQAVIVTEGNKTRVEEFSQKEQPRFKLGMLCTPREQLWGKGYE